MPPEEKKEKERVPIKSLRTYQGDVEEAIGKNKESSTTIFVAEQKRKEVEPEKVLEVKDNSTRNKFFVYISGIFFVLGSVSIATVYYIKSTEKIVIEQKTKTLLAFNEERSLPITSTTREQLLTTIKQEKDNFKLPLNSVLYLNATTNSNESNLEDVLSLIGPSMPSSLVRSFENNYMIGVYSYDTNEVFLILKVKDFASSYSGMLKWEKDMQKDLSKIFSIDTTSASTTASFVDEAIKNKDLRILKNSDNKTQLVYSFIDKETLIITKNETLFNTIVSKYTVSKQIK